MSSGSDKPLVNGACPKCGRVHNSSSLYCWDCSFPRWSKDPIVQLESENATLKRRVVELEQSSKNLIYALENHNSTINSHAQQLRIWEMPDIVESGHRLDEKHDALAALLADKEAGK